MEEYKISDYLKDKDGPAELTIEELIKENVKLEQENAELKEAKNNYKEKLLSNELDKYKKVVFALSEQNAELKKELEETKFYIDSYKITWEIDKYKQTLNAIKEIAEEYKCVPFVGYEKIINLIKESEQ